MENKRRSAFIAREGIQASLEFLDKHLQSIAIARIVGGVLAAVGAVYMLLWSVGVYSTAQEIGVQLVTLGSVISAVAMGFRLQSNGRASDLLKECHDLLPSTSGVPSSLGNGFRVFSLISPDRLSVKTWGKSREAEPGKYHVISSGGEKDVTWHGALPLESRGILHL
ncbi:uncharacterized protein [Littorina saxatilis]|uniref:uncharacterized protein isoform X2 n=1 Tax=Littorina saxatilis TaxID=31220 RepID=UPI0038B4BA52